MHAKLASKVLVMSLLIAGSAMAAEQKIAVVDVQKAMRSADKVKEIEAQLKNEFGDEEKKIEELQKKITDLKEKQKRDWAVMAEPEKRKLQEDGMKLTTELQTLSQESQRQLAARQQQLLQPVISDAQEAIKEIMKAEGYHLVMRREAVVEFDPKMDITLKVTLKLNEKSK